MSKLQFTIAPGGGVKIDAVGFTGTACAAATASYELLLSGRGENSRDIKPEWNEIETDTSAQQHASV